MSSLNVMPKSTTKVLANQTNKALFSLTKTLSDLSYSKLPLMCYLFDLLISPIMNHAAETRKYTVSDYNDGPEIVHHDFVFALGVYSIAPNLAAYGKLGRKPLSIHSKY